jgi:hypothetical protein
VKLINVFCTNVMCTWDQTSWVVQINEDGSIPDAAPAGQPRGEKQFGSELYLPSSTTNKWVDDANVRAAGMDNPGVKELGSG